MLLGVLLAGYVYDETGSLNAVLLALVVSPGVAALLLLVLGLPGQAKKHRAL